MTEKRQMLLTLCSLALMGAVQAQEYYSLWPRRPEALKTAQRMVREQQYGEAIKVLLPHVGLQGVAGKEVRALLTQLQLRHYVNGNHPKAYVYRVESGDNMQKIAASQQCSYALLLLVNGITDPSLLKVGQKLLIIPMDITVMIHEKEQEIALWDGDNFLASYPLLGMRGNMPEDYEKLPLLRNVSYRNGRALHPSSPWVSSSPRWLEFEGGICIAGEQVAPRAQRIYQIAPAFLNEWAIMLPPSTRLTIVSDGSIPVGQRGVTPMQ